MAGVFRLGFHRIALRQRSREAEDWRWSLAAVDHAANLMSRSFAASDGVAMPYRLWRAQVPRGLVLLLHGAFDYSGAFDEIGPRLAQRGLTALAIDQRGFGATPSRRHWCSARRMALDAGDAVCFLRARFGDLPVFLVGESMGADIAIKTVATQSDLEIAGVVLAAPGALADVFRLFFWRMAVRVLNFVAPKGEVAVERLHGGGLTAAAAIRLLSDPMVLRSIRPAMASGLLELAVSAVGEARKVAVPTLTLIGSKEDLLYTTCVTRLHDGLAGEKTLRIFTDGPHLLFHWQRADAVIDTVLRWIEAKLPEVQPDRDPMQRLAS